MVLRRVGAAKAAMRSHNAESVQAIAAMAAPTIDDIGTYAMDASGSARIWA